MAAAQFQPKGFQLLAIRVLAIALVFAIGYFYPPLQYWPMWVAAVAWIVFSVYWGVAAKKSAEAKTAESAASRRLHLILITAGQLLLFLSVPGLRQSFRPETPAWIAAGLTILAASTALAVWARRHLGTNWSGRIETKVDHELVRTGPYRKLRHPIYTAVMGMCVGVALIDGHAHALVGTAMVLIAYWRKVRMEETNLRQAFGDRYSDYREATWGAVPGLF
jgi:protein-S-isoprenylcysteine O-methyltransferase Ste14